MKKWSIFILAFLFALTGCAKEETENQILSSTSYNAISLDEAIEKSEFAIIGTYTDVTTFDEYVYFNFDVNEVLYGELNEATVSVYALREWTDMSGVYTEGQSYVLLLRQSDPSIYDQEQYYMPTSSATQMPVGGPYMMYGEAVFDGDEESFEEYLRTTWEQNAVTAQVNEETEITYDTEAEQIAAEATLIGYVDILSLEHEGAVNIDVYVASVDSLLKGDDLNTRSDGTILLSLAKGSVEVGERYLIAFDPADKDSIIYTQTTRNSVISDENQTEIAAVTELLTQ